MDTPRLIFGDDGSEHADRAWLWINNQVWTGWQLDVVTCSPPPLGPPIEPGRAAPHPWEPPDPRVPFAEAAFAGHRHLVAEADPRIVLTDPTDAACLVIGARGHGPLKALHLGSVAEYVVHHAPVPVVVVKKSSPVRSVLVATDGSTHAERATAALVSMPWYPRVREVAVVGVYRTGMYDDHATIAAAVDRTADALGGAGPSPQAVVTEGHPASVILSSADAMRADLVVIGTRGQTGLRWLLLGSTSGAVLRATSSTVLLASARG
jgi:nucleotide-binding universal stress UspA family protein